MKLFFLLLLALTSPAFADSVLFIGNSLTGVNNMPGLFRALASSQGRTPDVFESMKFGQTLGVHLADPAVCSLAQSRKWDVVILQEYSDLPLRKPRDFEAHITEFKKLVPGSRVLLFENWPYRDANAFVLPQLDAEYDRAAKASSVTVVHLGRAMDELRLHSKLKLFADDKHPTPIATYMNTLMMLDAVYGISPDVVPAKGSSKNTAELFVGVASRVLLMDLPADEVALAKATAAKFK